jgi:predicted Zn-dependent protease
MKQIEDLLEEDPQDAFLRYGLAMEYLSLGEEAIALEKLIQLSRDEPYVAAFLQAGQILVRLGRAEEAITIFRQGIEAARSKGDHHAMQEMQGMLSAIE